MTGSVLITWKHVRAARPDGPRRACASGIRAWARRHGVDLRRLSQGIPVEEAERLDDAYAQRVVALARKEAADA